VQVHGCRRPSTLSLVHKSQFTSIPMNVLQILPSLALATLGFGQLTTPQVQVDGQRWSGPIATGGGSQPLLGGGGTIDVVGSTVNGSSGAGLAKGNGYRVDFATTLTQVEFWLDFTGAQNLTYYVFDSPTEVGTYTELFRQTAAVTGTGASWYGTGGLALPLSAGSHYVIAVSWDGTCGYSFGVGDSEVTSFGEQIFGFANGTNPLPVSIPINTNDQAIYHQRLTTGLPNVGAGYCYGDGSGAVCPCAAFGGAGQGCLTTSGTGATLVASGNAAVGADTFQLDVSGAPANKPGLFFQGINQIANPAGDGLLCAAGATIRYGVNSTDASGAVSQGGFAINASAGQTLNYQYWFRDTGNTCGGGFNFSNGWSVSWL